MTRKGLVALANNGIEFFIGSMILVMITNLFSTEEAGAWIVFITLLFVGTKFREGVTQTSLMKFSVGVPDQQRFSVYMISIGFTLMIEILLSGLAYSVSHLIDDGILSSLLANYFWIAIPQSVFRLFQFISQSRLDVKNMFVSNAILLNMVIMVVLFILETGSAFSDIPKALGIAYMIGIVWQVIMHNALNWNISIKNIQLPSGYISFATNGLLRELFGTISSRAYILLTAGLVGYTESALVGIASRYANLIYLPNSAYQGILYPKACELANSGYLKSMFGFYRRSVSWMQAAFVPYVLILLSIGSLGIVFLHGTEFIAALPFYSVLVLSGAFIAPFGHAYGSICQAAGRPDLVTKVVLLNSGVNLILSVILIYLFGVWGAVLAPIITDILGLAIISIVMRRVFNTSILESGIRIIDRLISLNKIVLRILRKREALS